MALVRKTRSREGARLLSKFFQSAGDFKGVVEFCLIAGMRDEALKCAQVWFFLCLTLEEHESNGGLCCDGSR